MQYSYQMVADRVNNHEQFKIRMVCFFRGNNSNFAKAVWQESKTEMIAPKITLCGKRFTECGDENESKNIKA
jgi:hypothetical protein